jgi:hypothetical protein
MKDDGNAISRELNIGFDGPHAEVLGELETSEAVFRMFGGDAAVGDFAKGGVFRHFDRILFLRKTVN